MKKIALFLVSVLLFLGNVMGQGRFEWVRGYAPGEHVSIIGAVTDSLGNLYILGSFNFESRWENGELIMPITPHGGAQNGVNTLIAKISPEGEMVWKKVIHGNMFPSTPYDIKALGDTAFACLVTMPLACDWGYLYYLDTLVNDSYTLYNDNPTDTLVWPDYPMSAWGRNTPCMALITFDFDGNVLEQHFLQMSYLDRYGEDIFYEFPPSTGVNSYLSTQIPDRPSFDIDSEGHIYLTRVVDDKASGGPLVGGDYSLEEGTISAVKFWCDRRLVGMVPADSALRGSPQILKFAPHFDTLLNSRLVFQSQTSYCPPYNYTRIDRGGNLYVFGTLMTPYSDNNFFVVDSIQNICINKTPANNDKGYLIKFDTTLTAKYCISLEDSVIQPSIHYSAVIFFDLAFDYDSNLVFISGSTGRGNWIDTTMLYSILTCQGKPLLGLKNNSFFISLRMLGDSIKFHSYGVNPSIGYSDCMTDGYKVHGNLICNKNRVFIQSRNNGGIRLPTHNIEWDMYKKSLGLTIFNYHGQVIGGENYTAINDNNRVGPLSLRDSNLYLSNKLSSDATFGDIHVPSRGDYFACIAKYVDTAFMTPYVAPTPGPGPEGIPDADTLAINSYPNPVRDMLHIAIDDMVIHATAISLTGVRRQVPAKGNTLDLEALQPGVYILEIATMNRKYHHKIIKL